MEKLYDVVIVGGGPAGLTAALYLARAKYRVLVLEKEQLGGQIAITEEVVNYPGVARISGKALTETMAAQAESFGAELRMEEAVAFDLTSEVKTIRTNRESYRCLGVLLATGAHPRTVGFLGEEAYKGRGVAYCATCDGEFFTGKDIFVVGGGYAAAEESVFLTKYARHVTVLIRKGDFSCAASVADKAKNHEKITVLPHTVLEEVSGDDGLQYARYKNTATGQVTEYRAKPGEDFGVFVFAGYAPATEGLRGIVQLDEQGYFLTDPVGKTNVPGVYAAGDVRVKPLRQVVTATGDGALAATELEKYVSTLRQKIGMTQETPPVSPKKQEKEGLPGDTRQQLKQLFDKMEGKLLLKLSLDQRPVSAELKELVEDLAALTDKLEVVSAPAEETPCVTVCRENGEETGLAFHGVPGGHEFTSFVLGLYNAAGPGQPLEEQILRRIRAIRQRVEIRVLVTLSCSMCPETVIAAQRIAAENPNVTCHVYDALHFEDLRSRYRVMSVPCIVINGRVAAFGRKNLEQMLELVENG